MVQTGDFAILPQGEFVELANVIEVIDVTDQEVVWNLPDDSNWDYELSETDSRNTEDKKMNGLKMALNTGNEQESVTTQKNIGHFNTGFIVLLTLLIYPVLMIGTGIYQTANGSQLFREVSKLFSAIIRA